MKAGRVARLVLVLSVVLVLSTLSVAAAPVVPQEAPVEAPDYGSAAIAGVSLLFAIWGLVQIAKGNGLKGLALRWLATGLGLGLGVLYLLFTEGVPVDWRGWVFVLFYGLGLGIVSWGSNDATREIVAQGIRAANGAGAEKSPPLVG